MKESLTFGLAISMMAALLSSQPGCAGLVTTNADAGASGSGRAAAKPDVGGTSGSLAASGGAGAAVSAGGASVSTGGIAGSGGLMGTGGAGSSQCFYLDISAETVLAEAGVCRFSEPNPLVGQVAVDWTKVNITLVRNNGAIVSLQRDDSCQTLGWRIDDPVNPKYIELCAASCESLTTDSVIQVVGGCAGPGVL